MKLQGCGDLEGLEEEKALWKEGSELELEGWTGYEHVQIVISQGGSQVQHKKRSVDGGKEMQTVCLAGERVHKRGSKSGLTTAGQQFQSVFSWHHV